MATSSFQIDNFPNLDNPKYSDGGLFDNLKTNQYINNCIDSFKDKFPEQTSFFISKGSLKEILDPSSFFKDLIKEDEKELYAFAFCYCLDDDSKFLLPYLRLRLVYAKPDKYDEKDILSDKVEATVYANPIGKIYNHLSLMDGSTDNFEWLTVMVKILHVDEDTNNWADIHSIKFPLSPPLNTMHGQIRERMYEGNIIGRKRLNDIYEQEILKNKKNGIILNFAYDKDFNKIFLVFSIDNGELSDSATLDDNLAFRIDNTESSDFITLSDNFEPLKCPPEEIAVCKPLN